MQCRDEQDGLSREPDDGVETMKRLLHGLCDLQHFALMQKHLGSWLAECRWLVLRQQLS
jgi:hypothetical protein